MYAPSTVPPVVNPLRLGADGATWHPSMGQVEPHFRSRLYEPYNPPMTLTVGDLLRIPELDLRLVAGEAGTGGAIRWVARAASSPTRRPC